MIAMVHVSGQHCASECLDGCTQYLPCMYPVPPEFVDLMLSWTSQLLGKGCFHCKWKQRFSLTNTKIHLRTDHFIDLSPLFPLEIYHCDYFWVYIPFFRGMGEVMTHLYINAEE